MVTLRKRGQNHFLAKIRWHQPPSAIFDFGKISLPIMYGIRQFFQQMYNILPGNRSCDQKRRLTKIQNGGYRLPFRIISM